MQNEEIMKIPPVKVVFPEDDRREILKRIDVCLSTGLVAQGKNVKEFEDLFAAFAGVKHAVAVSSGGSAIELGMQILHQQGKEVIVPVNTFFASAGGVLRSGKKVRFVDVDPATFSPTLDLIKKAVTKNTAGVMLVHLGGIISPEIEGIKEYCLSQGIWLFEDCAHAHGSEWKGKKAGSFGSAGAYSFFATKVMTAGEGGMLVTNDDEIARRAKMLRDYGKPQPWVSYHVELGANWRMSDIAGIIGLVQLKRLNAFIESRKKTAERYSNLLRAIPEVQSVLPRDQGSYYKYIILLPRGMDREKVRVRMKEKGVSLSGGIYELPLHRQPIFEGKVDGEFPSAEDICSRHICLPIYYGMRNEEVDYVAKTLKGSL